MNNRSFRNLTRQEIVDPDKLDAYEYKRKYSVRYALRRARQLHRLGEYCKLFGEQSIQ